MDLWTELQKECVEPMHLKKIAAIPLCGPSQENYELAG